MGPWIIVYWSFRIPELSPLDAQGHFPPHAAARHETELHLLQHVQWRLHLDLAESGLAGLHILFTLGLLVI